MKFLYIIIILLTLWSSQLQANSINDITVTIPTTVQSDLVDAQLLLCNSNSVCENALAGVWALTANMPELASQETCYCNESQCPSQITGQPPNDGLPGKLEMNLFNIIGSPYAFTDCSGWIAYLLNNIDNGYTAAYTEINSSPIGSSYNGYTLAFAYQNYFSNLAKNNSDSLSVFWQGYQDLNQLQAGDILAWCKTIPAVVSFCDLSVDEKQTKPLSTDTGHVVVVIAMHELTDSEVKQELSNPLAKSSDNTITNVQYFRLGVVDSSSVKHSGNIQYDYPDLLSTQKGSATIIDSRVQYGHSAPTQSGESASCDNSDTYGGLGTGIIYIVQYTYNDGSFAWSPIFDNTTSFNEPCNLSVADNNCTDVEWYGVSFGRLKSN